MSTPEISTIETPSAPPTFLVDAEGNELETSPDSKSYKYRDFSSVAEDEEDTAIATESSPPSPAPSRNNVETSIRVQKFPVKLYAILAQKEFNEIITWMPHGRSWKVLKPNIFESMVMPLFFEYSNYHSFNRLVNAWSFRRVSSGPDRGSYYHELFLRGKPHLQKYMRRLPKTHKKLPMKKQDEPDFYRLDQNNPLPAVEDAPVPGAMIASAAMNNMANQKPTDSQTALHQQAAAAAAAATTQLDGSGGGHPTTIRVPGMANRNMYGSASGAGGAPSGLDSMLGGASGLDDFGTDAFSPDLSGPMGRGDFGSAAQMSRSMLQANLGGGMGATMNGMFNPALLNPSPIGLGADFGSFGAGQASSAPGMNQMNKLGAMSRMNQFNPSQMGMMNSFQGLPQGQGFADLQAQQQQLQQRQLQMNMFQDNLGMMGGGAAAAASSLDDFGGLSTLPLQFPTSNGQ